MDPLIPPSITTTTGTGIAPELPNGPVAPPASAQPPASGEVESAPVNAHGLSIGQLVDSGAPTAVAAPSAVGAVERAEDGLSQLADAVMRDGSRGGVAVAAGAGDVDVDMEGARGSIPTIAAPVELAPSAVVHTSQPQTLPPPPPPLLNPLQSTGPPPSSTIVEPPRSPSPLTAAPPPPGVAEPNSGGPSSSSAVVSAVPSPAPVPDATGPAVEVPTGERMVTVESGVGGDVEMAADTGAGTVGVGKRSIDEEGDEQERYAKRARESVEPPQRVELPVEPSTAAPAAPAPAFQPQPPSEPVSAAQSQASTPAPLVPAPAPVATPPQPPAADPTAALPQHYVPGTFNPTPRPDRGFTNPMTIPQHKAMLNIVRSLKKSKDSTAFLHPVDYIAFGIPHYPQFISKPMDLATVETKLFASNPAGPPKDKSKQGKWDTTKGTYSTVNDVINDVRQIWDNTNIFNGPTHAVSLCAKTLDDMFEKALDRVPRDDQSKGGESSSKTGSPYGAAATVGQQRRGSVSQVPVIRRNSSNEPGADVRPKREIHPPTPKDISWEPSESHGKKARKRPDGQMKWVIGAVNEMMSPKYADCNIAFLQPVDPYALGVPDYFQVIKKPMDLSTIKQKLAVNAYDDVSEVNKDVKLMFNNCYTYNPPGTPVHLAGKKLESVWTAKWKSLPPKEVPTQGRDDSEVGSVFEDEGYAEEDEEIARIEGQIADLHRRLDQLRKSKARRSSKSKTPGQPKASKASSHAAAAASSSSKPPKAAKNGSSSKPKKPSTGGAAGANGINGSSSSTKKQRRESAATYAEDDGDESEGEVGNVSLAQKQELADKIQEAGPDILQQAIQIIQETTSLGDNGEEIELDIDALPPATIVRLYNLVVRGLTTPRRPKGKKPGRRPGPQGPHNGGSGGSRKKVNDEHEAERIRRMEQQLARFDGGPAGGGGVVGEDDGEDDDDEDESGSESE